MSEQASSPERLHIVTYDVRGRVADTGEEKSYRQTGIVTQTHQLIGGLVEVQPDIQLAITQTGAQSTSAYDLLVPEGRTVLAQGVMTAFPEYLQSSQASGKDKGLVHYYYEERVRDKDNPIYRSLAEQYAHAVHTANSSSLLLQNPNPVVSLLKAEELGYLDDITAGQLNVTGVIHDVESYERRLEYIQDKIQDTEINLKLIAVSEFVHNQLKTLGVPEEQLYKVPNGMDINNFESRLLDVQKKDKFKQIKKRNQLPESGRMVLVPARRVEHKGHMDVIDAVKILKESGKLDDMHVAFTGSNMYDTRSLQFENSLRQAVRGADLEDKIFFLDELNEDEVAACFSHSFVSILASTEPEGFAYANLQAMLANVPVITTRLGGPLDYIEHEETGMFVGTHKPEEIAVTLEKLANDSSLYSSVSKRAQERAREYTTEKMVAGYLEVIKHGKPRLPFKIHTRKRFEKIGEGMYTEVYRQLPSNGFVLQLFKESAHELEKTKMNYEYEYLLEAYSEMPDLIPSQRFITSPVESSLGDTALVKKEVKTYPSANTLLNSPKEALSSHTFKQLSSFVRITKKLFSHQSDIAHLRELGSRVPDIIDPQFNNLLIDINGNLRLVDTNRTISVEHLKRIAADGQKLDIEGKKIHALVLQRLMFIDAKFFGKSCENIIRDPFYSRYLTVEDSQELFDRNKEVHEPQESEEEAVRTNSHPSRTLFVN